MIGEVEIKKKSITWNYFRRLSATHAQCNYCHRIYNYQTTVSHLLKHVRKKHSEAFLLFKNQDRVKKKVNAPAEETSMTSWPEVEAILQTDESKSWEKSAEEEQSPDIWSLYTEIDDAFAECNLCGVKLHYKDSVSDLVVHRKAKHSDVLMKCYSSKDEPPKDGWCDTSGEGDSSRTPQNPKDSFSNGELAANIEAGKDVMKLKKSKNWKYFTVIDKTRSKCKICQVTLSHMCTANLMRHVVRKHPFQLLERTHEGEKEAEKSTDDNLTGAQNPSGDSDAKEESEEETGEEGTTSGRTSALPEPITTEDPMDEESPTMNTELDNISVDEGLLSSGDEKNVLEDNTVAVSEGEMNPKKSKSWKYFTLIDKTYAKCKICQENVSHLSQSNLMKHVVRKHPCRLLARARGGQKKDADKKADDMQSQSSASDIEEGSEEETSQEVNTSNVPSSSRTAGSRLSKRIKMDDSIKEKNPVSRTRSNKKSIQKVTAKRKRESRRVSSVWKVFSKLESGFYGCKICGVMMSGNSCAGNLRRHLRRVHPSLKPALLKNNQLSVEPPKRETRRTEPIIHTFKREIETPSDQEMDETPGAGCSDDIPEKRSERGAGCLLSERLVQAVEEGNHLLRGLQNAMEKQGEALHRLVACLEGMQRGQKGDE